MVAIGINSPHCCGEEWSGKKIGSSIHAEEIAFRKWNLVKSRGNLRGIPKVISIRVTISNGVLSLKNGGIFCSRCRKFLRSRKITSGIFYQDGEWKITSFV